MEEVGMIDFGQEEEEEWECERKQEANKKSLEKMVANQEQDSSVVFLGVPKKKQQSPEEPAHKIHTKIYYLNYLHFRANIKKLYTKRRVKFTEEILILTKKEEKFLMSFKLWGESLLIECPVRGRNCFHYEFTDLRLFYFNKQTESETSFSCPICNEVYSDADIIYLREVQVLFQYLKHKTNANPKLALKAECCIDHSTKRVFMKYLQGHLNQEKGKDQENQNHERKVVIEEKIKQFDSFYETLKDPYVGFAEYTLGIPNKHQEKLKKKYLFGEEGNNQRNFSPSNFGSFGIHEEESESKEKEKEQNQFEESFESMME